MPTPSLLPLLVLPVWAASLASQSPAVPNAAEPLLLSLKDPFGLPVQGARGELLCRPHGELPALADLPRLPQLGAALPQPALAVGISDARGTLRFEIPATAVPPSGGGSGLVTTERGLGALVVDLQPGRAQRLTLQPMAAITTSTGSEPLTVFARASLADGHQVTLPARTGTRVPLPAGDYELWIHGADGWLWQRARLQSGQSTVVTFTAPTLRVQCPKGTHLQPAGRSDVVLCAAAGEDDADDDVRLVGAAASAPLQAWLAGQAYGPHTLTRPDGGDRVPWPPAGAASAATPPVRPDEGPAPSSLVVGLVHAPNDAWRAIAYWPAPAAEATDDERRSFASRLPPAPRGDAWLLLVHVGSAPVAAPWPLQPGPWPFAPERGQLLLLTVRDESGLPLADVACEYVPNGMPPALVGSRSDGRGVAAFGPVLGPGTVRLVDPRYGNQGLALDRIPGDGAVLVALPGSTLRGVATWPDGTPARSVVVTLRDTTGGLRPAQRAATSGDDGGFTFGGLPDQRALLLFASAVRNGHTWSGRLERTLAGSGEVTLVLRDEDPVLGHPGLENPGAKVPGSGPTTGR